MSESALSLEQWERDCASRRGETVQEFRAWVRQQGAVVVACDCTDYEACRGWRLAFPEFLPGGDLY